MLALGLCAASVVACGSAAPNSSVSILIPWDPKADAGEYDAFKAVIDQFRQETGITVKLQVTRGVSQQLDADLAAGDPPDVADLASPGAVNQYMGKGLRPLQISLRDYAQPWRGLAMLGTGTAYAVPVKADVQSLIWYSTSAVRSPPTSWAALQNLSRQSGTPWCLGLQSGVVSGWPGADWIADILMSRYPVGVYQDWLHGTLPWDSPQVSYAWQEWGALMRYGAAVPGDVTGALTTPFKQAMTGRCAAEHGALTATGLPSTFGYSYVRFPSVSGAPSPALVSGDFMGLFTDNPNARSLLSYLATDQAQALWVGQPGGDAFSADQAVPLTDYPQGVRRDIAGMLQPGAGTTLCFAAGDVMVPDVSTAFSQAVLEYVNNRNSLEALLESLKQTQRGAGQSPVWNLACSGRS
jgi:alpha-glucoside transport system substrate-binding protein